MSKKEKVLICGGGFGGVKAALSLANSHHYDVSLLNPSEDFQYYPTLYHTATGSSRANSSMSLRDIFAKTNVQVIKDKAIKLDRASKTITGEDGRPYNFDFLILALGVVTNYFNISGLSQFSYGIKSIDQVKRFKNHIHAQLIEEKKPDLNYIIVGAGPTGIELASALPAYIHRVMAWHNLAPKKINVEIVEALPRLLPNLPNKVSRKVKRRLSQLGIKVLLNSKVEGESIDSLSLSGTKISSKTVVWTAGVTNNPFFKDNGFAIVGRGKVAVDVYLQAEPNIFILGDNANTPYSGMAQTALTDGDFVANNLERRTRNKAFRSYQVRQPFTVIPAGNNWAVVSRGRLNLSGYPGYLVREAADIDGFHKFEPWTKAITQYLSEFTHQEDCQVCAVNMSAYKI